MKENYQYHATESSLHRLIMANADGIIIVDKLGNIRFANPAAAKLFSQPVSSLLDTPFGYPIVTNETTEIDVLQGSNQVIIVEMRVVEIEWLRQPAYLASLRDITERKEAETELRNREQFLALLNDITHTALKTETFPVMLQLLANRLGELFNADKCYITLWDETQQLALPGAAYNTSREQYIAMSLQSQQKTVTEYVLRTGKAITINNIKNSSFASTRTAFLSQAQSLLGLPLIAHEQKLGAVLITFTQLHDFTKEEIQRGEQIAKHFALALTKAQLYEQVQKYAEDLELLVIERTQELQIAYKKLQEMDNLKSELIAHISHELRTPVANLRLYLDLLENGSAQKQMHYREVLSEQVTRLMKLIEDTIELSHLNTLTHSETSSVIDLNNLVESVVNHELKNQPDRTLKLSFVIDTDPLFILGDTTQITRMVSNLTHNAIQYTPKGEIQVRTFMTEDQQYVCLQVQDTGIGISAEEMPLIFDSFFRGQMLSQLNVPGIGMGLTIAKRIVGFHNGEITVQSEPNKGSNFLVRLPAHFDTQHTKES